jgi:hypothetical protein
VSSGLTHPAAGHIASAIRYVVIQQTAGRVRRRSCTTQGKHAVKADILARLNDEYPASRHNTAWVLDEARSDPPRRREHWRRGDARARQKVLTAPLRNRQNVDRCAGHLTVRSFVGGVHQVRNDRRRCAAKPGERVGEASRDARQTSGPSGLWLALRGPPLSPARRPHSASDPNPAPSVRGRADARYRFGLWPCRRGNRQ